MLAWLNANISLATLFWLFPTTFLLHDFEEIIFVESWFKKNYHKAVVRVPSPMKVTFQRLSETTAPRFAIPVFLQLILYIIATFLAVEYQYYGMLIGFNVILFLHVFGHIAQSFLFRTYALGVGTAILITWPYSLYLFYRMIDENLMVLSDCAVYLPYGILTGIVVFGGHKLASKIL